MSKEMNLVIVQQLWNSPVQFLKLKIKVKKN